MADDEGRTDTTTNADQDETKPQGDGIDWTAEAREGERRAKENMAAARRPREAEEAEKTELQKLAERGDAAEKRAAEADGRVLRLEVAQAKGLTTAQAR